MRVEVKRDICIGAATCVAIAPDVFELDDELKAVVKTPHDTTPDDVILEAARSCPTLAIYIYDDAGVQVFPPPAT